MRAKKKPRWEYRGRNLLSEDGIQAYSDDDIQNLATICGITEPDQIADMRVRLEGAANIYRIWKNNHDDAPRYSDMKAAAGEIGDLVSQLKDRLTKLDDRTAAVFWRPEMEIFNLAFNGPDPTTEAVVESPYGHKIHKLPDGNGGGYICHLGMEEYFEALTILENYSCTAIEAIPTDRGAARKSEALRMWAINLERFWTIGLGRKFTVYRDKGEPLSQALHFCCEAFRVIEPSAPQSRVISAMEALTRKRRQKETPKNTPSK